MWGSDSEFLNGQIYTVVKNLPKEIYILKSRKGLPPPKKKAQPFKMAIICSSTIRIALWN